MWDPIGVAGNPGARDEYDSYLPRIFELVVGEASMSDIGAYLTEVESGSMGLRNDTERALQVAETLLDWREWIYDRAS